MGYLRSGPVGSRLEKALVASLRTAMLWSPFQGFGRLFKALVAFSRLWSSFKALVAFSRLWSSFKALVAFSRLWSHLRCFGRDPIGSLKRRRACHSYTHLLQEKCRHSHLLHRWDRPFHFGHNRSCP